MNKKILCLLLLLVATLVLGCIGEESEENSVSSEDEMSYYDESDDYSDTYSDDYSDDDSSYDSDYTSDDYSDDHMQDLIEEREEKIRQMQEDRLVDDMSYA